MSKPPLLTCQRWLPFYIMNARLEIASRIYAAMIGSSAGGSYDDLILIALREADALIKECGDQPSLAEISIIETNAAMVVYLDELAKRAQQPKLEDHGPRVDLALYQTLRGRTEQYVRDLKAAHLEIRTLNAELERLRSECQKLVRFWSDCTDKNLRHASEKLESVLKRGAK